MRFGIVAVLLLIAGCRAGRDSDRAVRGEIDPGAPLTVHLERRIDAPPSTVWRILADPGRWPDWQPDIHAVSIDATPAPGVRFAWTVDAGIIRSRIAALVPPHRLAWTGRLMWFHAIHVWSLSPTPEHGTLVSCDESLSGFLLGWFMTRTDLEQADARWLAALDAAAKRSRKGIASTG